MKLIEDGTRINGKNCITFTPRTNQGTYIKFIRGNGCYSYIGKKFLSGPQDLSLGEGCVHPIVAAHELIHALG
jgi:meprin B